MSSTILYHAICDWPTVGSNLCVLGCVLSDIIFFFVFVQNAADV